VNRRRDQVPNCFSLLNHIICWGVVTYRYSLSTRFDEAGRGACVKRYTDPTFFRLSWAASLLMKAERQRREREAELLVGALSSPFRSIPIF